MLYVNPFDLLQITVQHLSDVDAATISRARRKLLAELELSDTNTILHAGVDLNRGDCLRAIDDLDYRDKREFHFFIYQHNHLKRFLTKGRLSFFENYQAESIYKLPEFLDFISHFFAEKYDNVLLENYKRSNRDAVANILSVKPITNKAYYEKCYKSTYAFVKDLDNWIKEIVKDIANNESLFISKKFAGLDELIIEKVNVFLLNLLPSYFQILRNQIALSIRNLATDINNDHSLYEPAFKLIDIANNISTDALTRQKITKGYFDIKKNYDYDLLNLRVQKNAEEQSLIISTWQNTENQIANINMEIEEGNSKFIYSDFFTLDTLIYQIANPSKLNSLTNNFQGIRNQVASKIRSLAITINNEPYHKYKVAYDLINIAHGINTDGDVAKNVSSTFQTIKKNFDKEIKNQRAALKSKHYADLEKLKAQKQEEEANNQILSTWINKANQIATITKEILDGESKFISSDFFSLDTLIIQIADPCKLNSLSENFQNVRNQLASKVRFLAITINNEPHHQYRVAYELINIAKSINIDGEIADNVSSIYQSIKNNFEKLVGQQHAAEKSKHDASSQPTVEIKKKLETKKKNITTNTKIFAAILLLGTLITFFVVIYPRSPNDPITNISSNKNISPFIGNSKSNSKTTSPFIGSPKSSSSSNKITAIPYKPPPPSKPVYSFPHIPNGNITGCLGIRKQYNNNLDTKLIIACGSNTDAAVKLVNYATDKSIRYVYIRKNSNYTIRNIPEGKYYLKIAYGEEWGIKAGESFCEGRFTSNGIYKKGDKILDYTLIYHEDGSYQIPSFSLKLNVTYNTSEGMKNFSTNYITENDFYNE